MILMRTILAGAHLADSPATMVCVPADRPDTGQPSDDFFEALDAARERTGVVGHQLIGLPEAAARRLATEAGCYIRVTKRDDTAFPVTAEYSTQRIDVTVEHGLVVTAVPDTPPIDTSDRGERTRE
jgi:hypothetical protein